MSSITEEPTTDDAEISRPGQDATDEAPVEEPPEEQLSLDVVFEVLKNTRRRWVLEYLYETEDGTTLGELAEHIAAIENDKPRAQLDSQERKRVYVGLYQCHLPKMDDANVVDFDDDRGTVELGSAAPQVYTYLQTATEETEPVEWPRYYMGYAIGGLVVSALAFLALPASAGTLAVAAVLVGLVVLSGLHLRAETEADEEEE